MDNVVIVGAARTPIGKFGGSLSSLPASDLGSVVIRESLQRANIPPEDVSEVIMGQTLQAGEGQCPARQASVKAGVPIKVPAYSINMLCGSGLKSVILGYHNILVGDSKIVVCGGQESMSRAPHCILLREPTRMGKATLIDTMLNDGLTDAFNCGVMGVTAENIAKQHNILRTSQDDFAYASQQKVAEAQNLAYFDEEIVPVEVKQKNQLLTFKLDEFPKHGTTPASLAALEPNFVKDCGTVTAGNSSGVNDGAAAVVLTSEREAAARNIKPLARIVGSSQTGIEPSVMGLGPITAVEELLKKIGWTKEEVDLYELNEAFAAQSIAVIQGLGIDPKKVNINGGAIALGHPIGASGARVLVTLIYALKRTRGRKGVASLCVGGGMGVAMAIEMLL